MKGVGGRRDSKEEVERARRVKKGKKEWAREIAEVKSLFLSNLSEKQTDRHSDR